MESVEETLVHSPSVEGAKSKPNDETSDLKTDPEVCQKSNGLSDNSDTSQQQNLENNVEKPVECSSASAPGPNFSESESIEMLTASKGLESSKSESKQQTSIDSNVIEEQLVDNTFIYADPVNTEVSICSQPGDNKITSVKEINDNQNEQLINNDNVKFETEILVETNDNDVNELDLNNEIGEVGPQESASNILTELGQNLELSEALRSSDNAENGENNNHSMGQEVFNKEELLDILEGNDVSHTDPMRGVAYEIEIKHNNPDGKSEVQLALEQLSRLKKPKNRRIKRTEVTPRKRNSNIKTEMDHNVIDTNKDTVKSKKEGVVKFKKSENKEKPKKEPKNETSIVNSLVQDWDDDEPVDDDTNNQDNKDIIISVGTEQHMETQESVVSQDVAARTSVDSVVSDGTAPSKSHDDGQPQRRLGRVIKKKVIYDPDNPDTFTKSKPTIKKEPQIEEPLQKKGKIEQRPKSKSPIAKLQWKKPQPKNNKQNKRLSEVDKLLMDEGAVNMIYQLTPEAPKGKKNMRTKAEFIKKLQSSTPETKEMKFRERKIKLEEGEAKKIIGGKQRSSLSSSVKSPSVCEDFETHSADDSIIYRRHSSSSYSSACMSPRRLSDVEGSGTQNKSAPKELVVDTEHVHTDISGNLSTDVFVPEEEKSENISMDIINKDDCLSLKEKLNSKLSLALNKRKLDSSKIGKPTKQRKVSKLNQVVSENATYTYLSVSYELPFVAEILIRKTGSKCDIRMFKELYHALEEIDSRKDISVSLLMSESGALCSELDLSSLVNDNVEERTNFAYEYAEAIRLVLFAMVQHSKLLCTGVWGPCRGVSLALLALSDVSLAAEDATFALASNAEQPVLPGVMLLSSPWQSLPQTLVNDLVIFGSCLSAREAARGGLVSRVLLPGRRADVRAAVTALTRAPHKNILLKKRLLNLKNVCSNTFLSCLIKERDLIINYWTSDEGQELLRATITA